MKYLIIFLSLCMLGGNAFAQKQEVIEISTNDMSMIISATQSGEAVFRYWGEKLNDLLPFTESQSEDFRQIYPAYGGFQTLNPALRITHADGALTTELVYSGSEKKALDNNRVETIIKLKDKVYPLEVELHFVAHKKENVINQYISLSHKEKGNIKVENMVSSYFPLRAESYYLTHYHGSWAYEMQATEEKLMPGIKSIESIKGVSTTLTENPSFLLSLNKPAEENVGDVYGGSLAWSGNFKLSFEIDDVGTLHAMSGMNPFASTYNLKPNTVLNTPEMILTYSDKGKGQVSRNLHDWCRKYALAHGDKLNPVLLNSWEGAYFNFDEKTITDMIDAATDFGIELFVLDDGWFGNKYPRNADNAALGDWQENTAKLPNGIKYLADYAVSKGVRFGIWIEPEMISPKSELAEKHPEWVVKSGKREIPELRNQWILDLTNPQVQDFVVKTFDDVLSLSPNITYVKWDANRCVTNAGSEFLSKENQSHFWYEYVKGLYNAYERIRANHPDVEIQLCSSGGGRLDFGALKYHDEFWASDNTNALERIFIQYGENTFFPAQATASHVSPSPNHQTGMVLPLKFRFDVAMSGRLGMELQPKNLQGADYKFAKKAIADYKSIRPIVQFGDLYRLASPYDENGWASLMYVSKEKEQAVFFAYSLKYHPRSTVFKTKLNGLDPNKKYKVSEINQKGDESNFRGSDKVYSGEYLMKAGIILNIRNPFDSVVLSISEQ